ncbi:carboxypeptidase-like regulatory domain-containing protein [Chryseobacterium luquanense]|uniref:Carboxypeptidase-like regulatory domain-containing protein n=1 Tax=Chryseobacterium luquanense TaxID=2983766 RepID=A0ABT3Y4T2_9FLAO|nr:carboxypeptidase-like regulatory domain-containing protein [Chryseobacterium luquanense]MCX8533132.1 carboxypeptidase-like regulatory domain-containing protein [Chryseobacterium luquanense]
MARLILFIFVLLMSIFSSKISAQTASQIYSLSGSIDSDKINQVEINLFNAENKLVKTEIADQNGKFTFNDLANGNYMVKINKNGSEVYKSETVSVSENTNLPIIHLNEKTIEGVTITKAKPYIERQEGKMILNVETALLQPEIQHLRFWKKLPESILMAVTISV